MIIKPDLTTEQYVSYLEQCVAKSRDAFEIAEMLQDAYDDEDDYEY